MQNNITNTMYTIYLAGPMRNLPRLNFDAFLDAEERIRTYFGWDVLNPAKMDLDAGMNPNNIDVASWDEVTLHAVFDRDVQAIKDADGLVMLDGWKRSIGAQAEYFIGQWLKKEIHFYEEMLKSVIFCP